VLVQRLIVRAVTVVEVLSQAKIVQQMHGEAVQLGCMAGSQSDLEPVDDQCVCLLGQDDCFGVKNSPSLCTAQQKDSW